MRMRMADRFHATVFAFGLEYPPRIGAMKMKRTVIQRVIPHSFEAECRIPLALIPKDGHHFTEDGQTLVFTCRAPLSFCEQVPD